MTTIEGNKIIAEFDGWELSYYDEFSRETSEIFARKQGRLIMFLSQMQYHSSWDWIIPVYQKYLTCINKIDESNNGWFIIGHDIQDALLKADIKSLHPNLYEFIQWYNKEQRAQVSDTNK